MRFDEKQRLDYILEGTNVGTWEWNIQTGETVFDTRWCEIIGYSPEEIGPTSIETWIKFCHPKDLEVSNELLQKCFRGEADYYHYEARMRHKNGSWIWVQDRGKIATWTEDGQPEWMFGTHQDITERKQSEENLKRERQLFVSGPVVVFKWVNAEGWPVDYVSPNVEQLLGYSPEDILDGTVPYSSIVHSEDLARVAEEVQRYSLDGLTSFEQEYRMVRADGEVIHIYDYTVVVRNQNNQPTHYDGYLLDITDRKRAEKEILRMQKLESLGTVAGGIAHDFNNLLTGLYGNIEMAKLNLPRDSQAQDYLQKAMDVMQRTKSLTGQLLTFAKGGAPLLDTIDSDSLVRETVEFNLQGSNVVADIKLQDNLSAIRADKGQIAQVIANLTINARQAMPDGGKLTVEAVKSENTPLHGATKLTAEGYVCITFRDEGIGIPSDVIEHIFDPYFSTRDQGQGLGLAVAHSIIRRHNGHITVSTPENSGTTFTVFLPAAPEEKLNKMNDTDQAGEERELSSVNALLMDDEKIIRELGTEMLEYFGCSVATAADGEETLKKYTLAMNSNSPFNLVILDLTIPGGQGGQQTVREILKIHPQARVIVTSGYATDPVLANYTDYGFSGMLAKPFQLDDLQQEVSRVMNV